MVLAGPEAFAAMKPLDGVNIPFLPEGAWPFPAAKIGLSVIFYFYGREIPDSAGVLADCIADYMDRAGDEISLCSVNGGAFSPLKGASATHALWSKEAVADKGGFVLSLTGGESKDHPASFNFKCAYAGEEQNALSWAQFCFPFRFLAEKPAGYAHEMIVSWSERLRPYHAQGGIGLLFAPNDQMALVAGSFVMPMLRRFPGLQADNGFLHAEQLADGIPGVSWYNMVSDRLLAKTGKESLLDKTDKTDILAWRYPGGTGIVAGPIPELGDSGKGMFPEYYVSLHRVLRPLYAPGLTEVISRRAEGVSTGDFTAAWKYRYDQALA